MSKLEQGQLRPDNLSLAGLVGKASTLSLGWVGEECPDPLSHTPQEI